MTPWILGALALWLAQVFFAAGFKTVLAAEPQAALSDHLRGKDQQVELSPMGGRAQRAQNNYQESLLVFLGLALLLEIHGAPALGVSGAMLFLVARVLYVPAYLVGIYGLRTAVWGTGAVGLAMMAWAAWTAAAA